MNTGLHRSHCEIAVTSGGVLSVIGKMSEVHGKGAGIGARMGSVLRIMSSSLEG